MTGVGADGPAGPIIKCGRVRKNRMVLNTPEREKRVREKRMIWYSSRILISVKASQRIIKLGVM